MIENVEKPRKMVAAGKGGAEVERGGTEGTPDMTKQLRLSGDSLEELGRLHAFFERLGREAGWSDKLTMDLLLCCEELLTNTITYGFAEALPPGSRHAQLTVAAQPGNVTIELSDNAAPFNPLLNPDPDLTLDLEHRPIGGLGVYFVKRIMDELHYESVVPGPGNKLVMRKYIETTPGGR